MDATVMSLVNERKRQMRTHMESLRLVVDQKDGPDAARAAMMRFLESVGDFALTEGSVVSGYWPISTEIDPRPLLAKLEARGLTIALPVVAARREPLVFRRWSLTDPLQEGPFETCHPLPEAPEVTPDLVFVPLLAVDRAGYRLGHGGGYYDRTLASLRARAEIVAVGIGFGIQLVDRVPHDGHDARVDWILTDRDLLRADP